MKINNPLHPTGDKEHVATVLRTLASQENCDGEPYDQMIEAAEYIDKLEGKEAKEGEGMVAVGVFLITCGFLWAWPPAGFIFIGLVIVVANRGK